MTSTYSYARPVGDLGKRINLLIKQGCTFRLPFRVDDEDGNPKPLAGYTPRAQMRRTHASETAWDFSVVLTADTGEFDLVMSGEVTAQLVAGSTLNAPASKYVWDLEIEDPSGEVYPLAYGTVHVQAEVTR